MQCNDGYFTSNMNLLQCHLCFKMKNIRNMSKLTVPALPQTSLISVPFVTFHLNKNMRRPVHIISYKKQQTYIIKHIAYSIQYTKYSKYMSYVICQSHRFHMSYVLCHSYLCPYILCPISHILCPMYTMSQAAIPMPYFFCLMSHVQCYIC